MNLARMAGIVILVWTLGSAYRRMAVGQQLLPALSQIDYPIARMMSAESLLAVALGRTWLARGFAEAKAR